MPRLPEPADDGSMIPEVGIWGESKYGFIRLYCDLFTKAMNGKWDSLVYVDLFSGPGLVNLKDTGRLAYGSPLIALDLDIPFDRYIFCDATESRLAALQQRVGRLCPSDDVRFVQGDVNKNPAAILQHMPTFSKHSTVLGLCLADPFKMSNLHFNTVRALSARFLDFLVLIPTHMDANRNLDRYLDPRSRQIERFTGASDWKERWLNRDPKMSFDMFFTNCYGASMETLDYIYEGPETTKLIRSIPKNLPLYRLALFSRHPLGGKFWNAAKKHGSAQRDLFDP